MDIGTAKVSVEQKMQIPHHMVDVVDIFEQMNVVKFYHEAKKIFDEVCARGNIPILVGGTGFYIHCFLNSCHLVNFHRMRSSYIDNYPRINFTSIFQLHS